MFNPEGRRRGSIATADSVVAFSKQDPNAKEDIKPRRASAATPAAGGIANTREHLRPKLKRRPAYAIAALPGVAAKVPAAIRRLW